MAKKWHLADGGGYARCKAFIRSCPKQHFNSEEEARQAVKEARQAVVNEAKDVIASIRDDIDNGDMSQTFTFQGNLIEKSTFLRDASIVLDRHYIETGQDPEYIKSCIVAFMRNPINPYSQVDFYAERDYDVTGLHPDKISVKPVWRLRLTSKDPRFRDRTLVLPLETKEDGRDIKKKAYAMLGLACKSVYGDTPEGRRAHSDMMDSLVNYMAGIETFARGYENADKVGMSYFQDSNRDVLRATFDITESTITAPTIRHAYEAKRKVEGHPLDVELVIQNSMAGAHNSFWTVLRDKDGWTPYYTYANGDNAVGKTYSNAQDMWNDQSEDSLSLTSFILDEMPEVHAKRTVFYAEQMAAMDTVIADIQAKEANGEYDQTPA